LVQEKWIKFREFLPALQSSRCEIDVAALVTSSSKAPFHAKVAQRVSTPSGTGPGLLVAGSLRERRECHELQSCGLGDGGGLR